MQAPQPLPALKELEPGVLAWQFGQGMHDWKYPNTVDLTVYRKRDIVPDLQAIYFVAPNSLEGNWAHRQGLVMHRTGLCFDVTKMVNLPLNLVQQECNNRNMRFMSPHEMEQLFEQGMKIDINALFKFHNKAAHADHVPTFIAR
jgi:hypothetical protein